MTRRFWWIVFVLLAGCGVWLGFLLKWNLDRVVRADLLRRYPDNGVPVIDISLNGVDLEEINGGSKDVKYEENGVTVVDGGEVVLEAEGVQVKGRGNGTWAQEKKPYQLRFDKKVDLLGLGKARKWYLLANALDATNLRTEAAFYLEEMLGMEYRFEGEFVELYVDGGYQGLYYLTRAVEIGKGTVDLRDETGVLVELDNVYGGAEEYYETGNGDKLVVKDVVSRDKADEAMGEFLRDYNEFEVAVAEGDYEKVSELIDVRSFAQYYLLSEFTVNPDAYWTSFYMYKDGAGDKIHAGPGWDFDLTFANRSWGNWMGEEFYSPVKMMARRGELLPKEMYEEMGLVDVEGMDWYEWSQSLSRIMFDLMEMPEFQKEVAAVYQERMMGRGEELVWKIRQEEMLVERAAELNDEVWRQEGFGGAEEETDKMIEWIRARYQYFDEIYGGA